MKLGIIGSGRIAKRAVKELSFVPELQVSCVYNPSYAHGKEFAQQIGAEAALDLDEMAEKVDAVYIASPHGTHYDYALQMLEAGKHVLCEKPMAFRERQVKKLFDTAGEKKCILLEGITTLYCPGFLKIEEVVESGIIGDVVDVEATFTRLTPPGCREFDDLENGGSFTEFGTYTMMPVFRLLGVGYSDVRFMSISAVTGVDGYTRAVFSYADEGKSGFIRAAATAKTGLTAKSEGQLVITGTCGYILVPSPWWLTKYFEVRFEDPSRIERYECEFEGDGLRYEFREFVRRIIEGFPDSGSGPGSRQVFSREEREAVARAGVFERFLERRR
jgi:predicted dehydrogenase